MNVNFRIRDRQRSQIRMGSRPAGRVALQLLVQSLLRTSLVGVVNLVSSTRWLDIACQSGSWIMSGGSRGPSRRAASRLQDCACSTLFVLHAPRPHSSTADAGQTSCHRSSTRHGRRPRIAPASAPGKQRAGPAFNFIACSWTQCGGTCPIAQLTLSIHEPRLVPFCFAALFANPSRWAQSSGFPLSLIPAKPAAHLRSLKACPMTEIKLHNTMTRRKEVFTR